MEAQQKRFLKKFAKGLSKDVDPNVTNKKLKQCFERIVQNLPSGTDIKHALDQHRILYLKFFIRCVRKACSRNTNTSQPTVVEDGDTVATAADQNDSRAESCFSGWLSSRYPQNLSQSAQVQFTVQQIFGLTNLRHLTGIVDQFEASCGDLCSGVEKFSKLLALTTGSRDLAVLKKIMQMYFNTLQEEFEDIVSSKSEERAKQKEQALREFLQLCHFRRSVCEQDSGNPSYIDLLASLLSQYLDLFLVSHGGDTVGKKEQRQVCSFIHHLMSGCDMQIFDVILQVTAANQGNACWLLPLVSKILKERRPLKRSHDYYLRFVLAVRMWSRLLDLQDVAAESRMVRAPKGFMEWLVKRNPLLSEELPTDRKFKGRVVTGFILDDADDNVYDMLLDALIDATKGQDEEPSGGNQQREKMDIDGDSTAPNIVTSGGTEEEDGQGKKRKKNKKKTAKKSVLLENGVAPDADEPFVVDRVGNSSLSLHGQEELDSDSRPKRKRRAEETMLASGLSASDEKTVKRKPDSVKTEVFDLSNLFFLDRGVEKTAIQTNNVKAETEANRKKPKKRKPEEEDAGHDSTTELLESSHVPGKPKKNYQNAANRSHVEDVGQTSETQNGQTEQGITSLFVIDHGDKEKKTKDSRLASRSFHSEDVIESSDSETNHAVSEPSSGFFIDRGAPSTESKQVSSEKTPRAKKASTGQGESDASWSGQKKISQSGKLYSTEPATNMLSMTAAHVGTTSPKKSTGTETAVMTRKRIVSEKSEPVSSTKPVGLEVSVRSRRRTASEKAVDTSPAKCSHDVQFARKLNSSKLKQSIGSESNSMDEDFQIITDSATDTEGLATQLTRPIASESEKSAKSLKLESDKAKLLSDTTSFSDTSCRLDSLVKRLSSPTKSFRVEASVSDSEEDGQSHRPVPDLKVHLKPQSPKKGTQIDQSGKEDLSSSPAVDKNKKEMRQKRKRASMSQTSLDEIESNTEGETYFSPVCKRKDGGRNVSYTSAKQSVKPSTPVKVSSPTKTSPNSSFTGIKRKSTTPVSRRTRSRKEDSNTPPIAASLKKMASQVAAGGKQTEMTSGNHDSENEVDFPKITPEKKVMSSELTDNGTPRTGKLVSSSKKGSRLGCTSKKAERRKSSVATRLKTDTSTKKYSSRRELTGALQSKMADNNKSSKDIGEYFPESSRSGALPLKVTEAEQMPQSSPMRFRVESLLQEMGEKHTPQKSSPRQPKGNDLENVTEKKQTPLKSSPKRQLLNSPSIRSSSKNTASPSQKQPSIRSGEDSYSDTGSHIIETRSKASEKGYNLRRSGKLK